jgi:hypothetical protein
MGNVFRLTERTGAPLWLLDSGAQHPSHSVRSGARE